MANKRFPFIVIEGIDGVGKTTCAKLLGEKIDGYYYKTPSGPFEEIRTQIDNLNNLHIRFIFYLNAVFFASSEISKLLLEKPVVCDRYIYSTIVYHKALGVDFSYIRPDKLPILLPDFSIYLWADEKTRIQRLINRDSHSSDELLEKNKKLQQRIHYNFLALPLVPINTSNLFPQEICNEILAIIQKPN